MNLRKSTLKDIPSMMAIIEQAQCYFKEAGIDQWQNGYPNADTIKNDIALGYSYVLESDTTVVATVAIAFDKDENYDVIEDGKWLSNKDYAVIHRIAVDNSLKGKGISSFIISEVEKMCLRNNVNSIKVDTHEDNKSMQQLLLKNDFNYCGVIYLADGAKRVAFEKIV